MNFKKKILTFLLMISFLFAFADVNAGTMFIADLIVLILLLLLFSILSILPFVFFRKKRKAPLKNKSIWLYIFSSIGMIIYFLRFMSVFNSIIHIRDESAYKDKFVLNFLWNNLDHKYINELFVLVIFILLNMYFIYKTYSIDKKNDFKNVY